MIVIFVEFIDQLIDYPINRATLNVYHTQRGCWDVRNYYLPWFYPNYPAP